MRPYTDRDAGRQLFLYGQVYTLTKRAMDGTLELFILDREEIKELQDEQIIR